MRTHLVLVPGFGGFDALGQLHYYNGVTALRGKLPLALHYFDNLPTAAVDTRAKRLRRYLAKLVDRNIVESGDRVVLVGHSTGGLDIRRVVRDLDADNDSILDRLRLAFLSVPHRGTNIADWVRAHWRSRQVLISSFRQAVGVGLGVPHSLLAAFGWVAPGHSQLFDAVEDVRCDFEPLPPDDQLAQADARHARAEVNLWLDDTDHDFLAIDDLASEIRGDQNRLVESLDKDVEIWTRRKIEVRSYATMAPPTLPTDELDRDRSQRSLPAILQAMHADVGNTDAVFRTAFAACAGGPFRASAQPSLTWLGGKPHGSPLEDWQNDGIVNTASMLLPVGKTFLVSGDHADIIGHFTQVKNEGRIPGSRTYSAYDLLGSNAGFTPETFAVVWNDLFEFAI